MVVPKDAQDQYGSPQGRSRPLVPHTEVHHKSLIGASLSEPHASETALQDACMCMFGTTDYI